MSESNVFIDFIVGYYTLLGDHILHVAILIGLSFLITTLTLKYALRSVTASHKHPRVVVPSSIIIWLLALIPFLGIVLQWLVIKYRHESYFIAAIMAWFWAVVLPFGAAAAVVIYLFDGLPLFTGFFALF